MCLQQENCETVFDIEVVIANERVPLPSFVVYTCANGAYSSADFVCMRACVEVLIASRFNGKL